MHMTEEEQLIQAFFLPDKRSRYLEFVRNCSSTQSAFRSHI